MGFDPQPPHVLTPLSVSSELCFFYRLHPLEVKHPSKIFVKAYFGLILSIRAFACYLGKVKKFYTNASFVQKNIPSENWKIVEMTAPAVLVLEKPWALAPPKKPSHVTVGAGGLGFDYRAGQIGTVSPPLRRFSGVVQPMHLQYVAEMGPASRYTLLRMDASIKKI